MGRVCLRPTPCCGNRCNHFWVMHCTVVHPSLATKWTLFVTSAPIAATTSARMPG